MDSGVIILTTDGAAIDDYAIYATTTAGYVCTDSYGSTVTNGVAHLPIDPVDANGNVPEADGHVVCE